MDSHETKQNKKRKAGKVKAYVKYSGIAYQLFGLIAVSIFLGLKADKYFQFETKYITAGLTLLVFFAYMYKLSITVMKDKS